MTTVCHQELKCQEMSQEEKAALVCLHFPRYLLPGQEHEVLPVLLFFVTVAVMGEGRVANRQGAWG